MQFLLIPLLLEFLLIKKVLVNNKILADLLEPLLIGGHMQLMFNGLVIFKKF
jgi:hypothetical protein